MLLNDDVEGAMARLRSMGLRLVDERPRVDPYGARYFYVHLSSAHRRVGEGSMGPLNHLNGLGVW